MKTTAATLILLLATCLTGYAQENTLELPLITHKGYGPFVSDVGFTGLATSENYADEASPWHKTFPEISKLPEGLTDIKYGFVETNIHQSVYQDYLAGNITPEWYDNLQKSWSWTPDTLTLSKAPIKTKVAFAFGKDPEGVVKFALDTDNDLDLSEEELFIPLNMAQVNDSEVKDSVAQQYAVEVSFESYIDHEATTRAPLLVVYFDKFDMFMCNLVQYATAQYKGRQIAVNLSYIDQAEERMEVTVLSDDYKKGDAILTEDMLHKGEYIELGDGLYEIVGVSSNKSTLVLKKIDLKSQMTSTQIGYKAPALQGEEFTTKAPVSLEDLKGKYVLLDFWAEWCAPCIAELPNLKELYAKTDRSKFEIVGVIAKSSPEGIAKLIEQHGVTWPQVMSDKTNTIVERYSVNSYPTTYLIDPQGVIVAKNLRGQALESVILTLIEQ